jgi:hypothetical protein
MRTRLDRLAPLTGVVSALLGIAGYGMARPGPGPASDGSAVIAFYAKHATSQQIADTLLMLSAACLVAFAAVLRSRLRRVPAGDPFAAATLAGAAVVAAGAATYLGADYTLAADPGHLAPAAAQALNLLGLKLFFPVSAGVLVFGVAAGLGILRSSQLPKWLGVAAILIGILAATPLTLAALFALFVWSAISGLILWSRSRDTTARQAGVGNLESVPTAQSF